MSIKPFQVGDKVRINPERAGTSWYPEFRNKDLSIKEVKKLEQRDVWTRNVGGDTMGYYSVRVEEFGTHFYDWCFDLADYTFKDFLLGRCEFKDIKYVSSVQNR